MSDDESNSWHLSKTVPIALIVGLIGQGAVFVWFASQMDATIQSNTARIERAEIAIETARERAQEQAVALGRIETTLLGVAQTLRRIDQTLGGR